MPFNPFDKHDWEKLGNQGGDKAKDAFDSIAGDIKKVGEAAVKEVEATGQKVARTLPKEAEKALNEALEQVQKVATRQLLNQIIDLAESAAPNRLAEIPIIPCTPFTPGLGLAIDLKESIGTLQKYYNKPPKGKQGYLRMARDLAGDQDAIILLPAGNGKVYIPVEFIDRQIDKLI